MREPDFLVIGAMKSATTSLCDLLSRHPEAFVCEPKEPEFFCKDEVYARGWDWYLRLFEGGPSWDPATRRWAADLVREDAARFLSHCGRPAGFWNLDPDQAGPR